MIIPNFAIVSLPRCGSTTLFRSIEMNHGIKIAYEPYYADSWQDAREFDARLQALKNQFNGIKHVWDPNGWPYVNREHISTMDALSGYQHALSLNIKLVSNKIWDKVIFLRRKSQLARVVSDLMGQQTGLWGHDPQKPYQRQEKTHYQSALMSQQLKPLDLDVIGWYVDHMAELEDALIDSISASTGTVVWYEDLLGSYETPDERYRAFSKVFDALGLSPPVDDDRFRLLVSPASKYNDISTVEKIPNIKEIRDRFGPI